MERIFRNPFRSSVRSRSRMRIPFPSFSPITHTSSTPTYLRDNEGDSEGDGEGDNESDYTTDIRYTHKDTHSTHTYRHIHTYIYTQTSYYLPFWIQLTQSTHFELVFLHHRQHTHVHGKFLQNVPRSLFPRQAW